MLSLVSKGIKIFGLPYMRNVSTFNFSQFFDRQDLQQMKNMYEGQQRKKYLHYKLTDQWKKPLQKKKRRQLRIKQIKQSKIPVQPDIQKLVVHNDAIGIQYPPKSQEMFAIVKVDGFQYKVLQDSLLLLDKKPQHQINKQIIFKDVNLIGTKSYTLIGRPYVQHATVQGIIQSISDSQKIIVFKKKRRKGYKKSFGSRNTLTQCRITKIIHQISQNVINTATRIV